MDVVPDEHVVGLLEPGEELRHRARAVDAYLAVTDRRLVVAEPERVALALPIGGIRRIQFDVERDRPATLVIVPEEPHHEPQVLAIPRGEFRAAAEVIVAVGLALTDGEGTASSTPA
jgi:hypothetical protein